MKKLLIIFIFLLTACSQAVSAQSNVLWEDFCPSSYNVVTIDSEFGSLVRCEEKQAIITPTLTSTITPTLTLTPTLIPTVVYSNTFIINHTNINNYNLLTQEDKINAQNKKFMFVDRSVGQNINEGLGCLNSSTWLSSLAPCRNYWNEDQSAIVYYKDYNTAPEIIKFPGGDNRNNIVYILDSTNNWITLLSNFVTNVSNYHSQGYKIFAINLNYLMLENGSRVDFDFISNTIESLESLYPDSVFVYMTSSLSRVTGNLESQTFNNQVRNYVNENNKYLLDIADIESHDINGNECLLNGYPIICRDYTVEVSGGHLISGGKIKIAKGIWLLLSNIDQ